MSYIKRSNPSIKGMGCMWCGGAGDDFDSPAYGYSAAQSARDQPGIDYTAMGMPSQTQLLAASSDGTILPLTTPSSTTVPYAQQTSVNQPGSMALTLANTRTDNPTPTALTVSQSFQSGVPGSAQPGVVNLYPNETADWLGYVQSAPGPAQLCPVTNWFNTANPWLLAGAAFAAVYLLSNPKRVV